MRELGIEAKIELLMQLMREVHNRFEMHHWVQDWRPWAEGTKAAQYWVVCACGENRRAVDQAEFNGAEYKSDGY